MITIRHLRTFLAVADNRSMSGAAARLYVSQPTVSQTISELERDYGVRLFERYPKELFLTPAGETLRTQATEVVVSFDRLGEVMQDAAGRPALRVGGTLTVGSTVLCPILDAVRAALPGLDLSVHVDNTRAIEGRLLRNELDAAIVEGTIRREEIYSRGILKDRLVLVCAPAHPLAMIGSVELEELAGEDFLLREKGSGTRALFEEFMAVRRIPLTVKWESGSATALKQAALRGYGVAVLSRRLVGEELERGDLRTVEVTGWNLERTFYLCHHRSKVVTQALQVFLDLTASILEEHI